MFLGQEGFFVGVVGPGTVFSAAQSSVLIRYPSLASESRLEIAGSTGTMIRGTQRSYGEGTSEESAAMQPRDLIILLSVFFFVFSRASTLTDVPQREGMRA